MGELAHVSQKTTLMMMLLLQADHLLEPLIQESGPIRDQADLSEIIAELYGVTTEAGLIELVQQKLELWEEKAIHEQQERHQTEPPARG